MLAVLPLGSWRIQAVLVVVEAMLQLTRSETYDAMVARELAEKYMVAASAAGSGIASSSGRTVSPNKAGKQLGYRVPSTKILHLLTV